ncbi:MAG: hypothetical protein WBD40_18745 [Tepidisphaeraceae bacterium]
MRDNYKYLYDPPQAPSVQTFVAYSDPVRTEDELRAIASRLAKQRAALRRAKLAERWIVFTTAAMLAIVMLPVLVVVGAGFAARALWRRWAQSRRRQRDAVVNDDARLPKRLHHRQSSSEAAAICVANPRNRSATHVCAALNTQ